MMAHLSCKTASATSLGFHSSTGLPLSTPDGGPTWCHQACKVSCYMLLWACNFP